MPYDYSPFVNDGQKLLASVNDEVEELASIKNIFEQESQLKQGGRSILYFQIYTW